MGIRSIFNPRSWQFAVTSSATAYSVESTGASGKWSHPGTVAADRKVLPLNSRVAFMMLGHYSGEYTVEDSGAKVDGDHRSVSR